MDYIYIAMVDTPGLLADIIREATGNQYIHVVISLDENLQEAYSFGRRNPWIPMIAGFEQERTEQIINRYPTAKYKITRVSCDACRKEEIRQVLHDMYQNRYSYHYCVAGLFAVLFQKPFHQKNHYTCSSFVAQLLEQHGMKFFDKDYSLVTPDDFYQLKQLECIYEGALSAYIQSRHHMIGVAYES